MKSLRDSGRAKRGQPEKADRKPLLKSQLTRQRILDAAAKAFSQHGYAVTRLSDIAKTAKIHTGALYYHFASRDALVSEVLRLSSTRVLDFVQTRLQSVPPTLTHRERITLAIEAHLTRSLARDDYTSAYLRIHDQIPHKLRIKVVEYLRHYGEYWKGLIEDARRAGEMRTDIDPSVVRLLMLGSMTWALEWYRPGKLSPADIAREAAVLFFDGVATPGSRKKDGAANGAKSFIAPPSRRRPASHAQP